MSDLIPGHRDSRYLKGFQVSQLIFGMTARFVENHMDRISRTRGQMVPGSKVLNIAKGSKVSATSKKTELKHTQVAGPAWKN